MMQSRLNTAFHCPQPLTPTVSIVGSAGRRADGKKMTKKLFDKMVEKAKTVIKDDFKLELKQIHVISGGAAWAGELISIFSVIGISHFFYPDHIAVILYSLEEVNRLTLHLPAKWGDSKFVEKKVASKTSWKSPGQSSNELHKQFSDKIGEDSLGHIEAAITLGAKCHIHDGFQKRNTEVAKSSYLLAFTWNEGSEPKKGGTVDTWKKCQGVKRHICLNSLCVDQQDADKHILQRKRSYGSESDDIECDGPKRPRVEK